MNRHRPCLGLSLEGRDLTACRLSGPLEAPVIETLAAVRLPEPLRPAAPDPPPAAAGEADPFGPATAEAPLRPEPSGVSPAILEALQQVLHDQPLGRLRVAFNVPPEDVRLSVLERPQGVAGRRLKRWLVRQTDTESGGDGEAGQVRLLPSTGPELVAVRHAGPFPLVEAIAELAAFYGHKVPRYVAADVLEGALMTALALGTRPATGEAIGLVHLSPAAARPLVAVGGRLQRVLPAVAGDPGEPDASQRLASRLLLEQDEGRVPPLARLVLTGSRADAEAVAVFARVLPETRVELFRPERLQTSGLDPARLSNLAPYAPAIGLALGALAGRRAPAGVDFLPAELRRSQRAYNLAWHGLVLLVLLGVGTAGLVYTGLDTGREIRMLRTAVAQRRAIAGQWESILASIAHVEQRIKSYQSYLTTVQDLKVGMVNWTGLLDDLSQTVAGIPSLVIDEITCRERGFTVVGHSDRRERVALLAARFQGAQLDHVTRLAESTGLSGYEYELEVPFPDGVMLRGIQKTGLLKNRRR